MADTQQKYRSRQLREAVTAVTRGTPLPKIDEEAGILYDVKILGFTSVNSHGVSGAKSTRYTREACKSAINLYENADVFLNHKERDKQYSDDDANEKLGVFRNVHEAEDGLRGEFHYLKSVPFNQRIVEDAKRGLGVYSFSHDANGSGEVKDGVFVIDRITEVRRVDIVSRGATNRTLYESDRSRTMSEGKITHRKLWESRYFGLSKPRQLWVSRLLEQDFMKEKPLKEEDPLPPGGLEVDAPPAGDSGDDAMRGAFKGAVDLCVDQMLDGTMDPKDGKKKVDMLIATYFKVTGSEEPAAPAAAETTEDEETDEEKAKKEKAAKESAKPSDAELELGVIRLAEQKKCPLSSIQRRSLIHLTESERVAAINEILAERNKPRSAPYGGSPPPDKKEKQPASDHKSFAAAVLR